MFKVRIIGHHLDKFKQLEKAGIVKYTNVKTHPNGFWEADVNFMGLVKRNNCCFPEDWNEVKVMKAAVNILENPYKAFIKDKKLHIDGFFCNQQIRIVIIDTNIIKTLFPVR